MTAFVLAPLGCPRTRAHAPSCTCRHRLAITRSVTPSLAQGLLAPGVNESAVCASRAATEHADYVNILRAHVGQVQVLPALEGQPDAVFVEDTAVVHGDRALQGRMGHVARSGESAAMTWALRAADLNVVQSDAKFDGGDVLQANDTFFVGLSGRTELACVDALSSCFGLNVVPVDVDGGTLHLKCVVTWVERAQTFVYEDSVAGRDAKAQMSRIERTAKWISAPEGAANVLDLGNMVVVQEKYWDYLLMLRNALKDSGVEVMPCNFDEIAKANGSLTCCSILVA